MEDMQYKILAITMGILLPIVLVIVLPFAFIYSFLLPTFERPLNTETLDD